MKNFIKVLLSLTLLAGILYACSENSDEKETIRLKSDITSSPTIDNNTVGYIDDSGNFVAISETLLIAYWKHKYDIAPDVNFIDVHILGGTSETGDALYIVRGKSEDGTINIGSVLKLENGLLILDGRSCKCGACSTWSGCEPLVTSSGCSCSLCHEGGCKNYPIQDIQIASVFGLLESLGFR